MVRSRRKKFLLIFLIVAVVVTAIVALFHQDLAGIAAALGRAKPWLVAAAIGVYFSGLLLWAVRWCVSLSAAGYRRRLRDIYLTIQAGIFITNITPLTYSCGDPLARTIILKNTQGIPYRIGFATILAEFMFDLLFFFPLLAIGLMFIHSVPAYVIAGVGLVAAVVLLLAYILSRRLGLGKVKGLMVRVFNFLLKRSKETIVADVDDFFAKVSAILRQQRVAATVCVLSIAGWIFVMGRLFIIFQALGHGSVPLAMLILAITLPSIVGLIPLLPGGLGTVDAAMFSIFLLFGVPAEIAMGAILIERFITFVLGTLLGAGVLSYLGISRVQLKP